MMKVLEGFLKKEGACSEAYEWSHKKSFKAAWDTCDRADWMLWVLIRLNYDNQKILRLFAVWCARESFKDRSMGQNDPRSIEACNVAEKYALGQATDEELTAAESAAWSAARSAAESAAWSAARSAAESAAWSAARSAAESAAWSAARSAESAAWSAAWSAESAAWSAARSAAESAAWSAAWSAESAESAAESARLKIEANKLREMITEIELIELGIY